MTGYGWVANVLDAGLEPGRLAPLFIFSRDMLVLDGEQEARP